MKTDSELIGVSEHKSLEMNFQFLFKNNERSTIGDQPYDQDQWIDHMLPEGSNVEMILVYYMKDSG